MVTSGGREREANLIESARDGTKQRPTETDVPRSNFQILKKKTRSLDFYTCIHSLPVPLQVALPTQQKSLFCNNSLSLTHPCVCDGPLVAQTNDHPGGRMLHSPSNMDILSRVRLPRGRPSLFVLIGKNYRNRHACQYSDHADHCVVPRRACTYVWEEGRSKNAFVSGGAHTGNMIAYAHLILAGCPQIRDTHRLVRGEPSVVKTPAEQWFPVMPSCWFCHACHCRL